mmetsp:Transcript_12191/g.31024  ORF Transcript_12191/g.31024 Transcript_12191/m.31024 type:complete len:233 (+) Transcript_12191:24-722(+)
MRAQNVAPRSAPAAPRCRCRRREGPLRAEGRAGKRARRKHAGDTAQNRKCQGLGIGHGIGELQLLASKEAGGSVPEEWGPGAFMHEFLRKLKGKAYGDRRNLYALGALGACCLACMSNPSPCMAETSVAYEVAALNPSSASVVAFFLRPSLGVASLFMIVRIVLTWFPEAEGKKFPWSIFYYSTEPVLSATRAVIKPVGGVDISPIVWFAFLSFMNEILLGPQGILVLLQNK